MTVSLDYGRLYAIADSGDQHRVSAAETVASLFESARDDVYRYLLTLGLAPAQAQDATQEVFLRLYKVIASGQRIQNPRGWVFRVAHNHGLTLRGREQGVGPMNPELAGRMSDPSVSPERRLIEEERRTRLKQAVESLSPQQRQCLHLRGEGFRYREIAEILGISDSSVSEFLRRALVRLRKALDG